MFRKQIPSRVLFVILLNVLLLTAAILVKDGLAEVGESDGAFVNKEAKVQANKSIEEQESRGAEEQSAIHNPQSTTTITYTYDDAGRLVGVDYGNDTSIGYTYDAAGNLLAREVIAPVQCHELTGVKLTDPPTTTTVGIATTFTAAASPITATPPITYTWQATGQVSVTHTGGGISDTAVFTWNVVGPQVVVVRAANPCGFAVSDTCTITVEAAPPPPCHELTGVTLDGPLTTTVDIPAAFIASASPITATPPITYTWEATRQVSVTHTGGGLSNTVQFTWGVTGTKKVTVTAGNECGDSVSKTHTITVEAGGWYIYLPLILRNF